MKEIYPSQKHLGLRVQHQRSKQNCQCSALSWPIRTRVPPEVSPSAQPYARRHPTTEHIAVDRNTKLTILSSLESTFEFSATQSAVIVVSHLCGPRYPNNSTCKSAIQRDEAALLVYSDDARSVAQRFLQVEQQLRQYARQCKCTVASSSESHSGSSTDAQPVSSHSHGYLFASEHGVASASDGSYVGPSTELPELDLPFRPLNVEEMVHDMQVCPSLDGVNSLELIID